jgi:hypothetical protein
MEKFNTLFCSSEFPWARKGISSKFIENLGTRPIKGPAEHNLKFQKINKSFYPSGLCCMTQLKK